MDSRGLKGDLRKHARDPLPQFIEREGSKFAVREFASSPSTMPSLRHPLIVRNLPNLPCVPIVAILSNRSTFVCLFKAPGGQTLPRLPNSSFSRRAGTENHASRLGIRNSPVHQQMSAYRSLARRSGSFKYRSRIVRSAGVIPLIRPA